MVKGIRSNNSFDKFSPSYSQKDANFKILSVLLSVVQNYKKSSKKKVIAQPNILGTQIEYTLFAKPLSHGKLTNYLKKLGKLNKNRVKVS